MKTIGWALLAPVLFVVGGSGSGQEKVGPIELKVVKYDGLKEAVLKNRGKVVLVDFWGEY
jgi:hypothetical protein